MQFYRKRWLGKHSSFIPVIFIVAFFIASCSHLPDYSTQLPMRLPLEGKAEAIGEYSLGCLRGAQTFSGEEKGLLITHKNRGRYWGHPDLIDLLKRAGIYFDKSHKKIILGDLSLSRGGPTITGHNSHQNGLDVDIWFKVIDDLTAVNFADLETQEMKPINELGEDQLKLIHFFASDPSVERIFINPMFKKKLCHLSGNFVLSPYEQHKMRAWWGHDDHIHVRLKCPRESLHCTKQKAIPEGDGCGSELEWWFGKEAQDQDEESSWEKLKSTYLDKIKKLPNECSFYEGTY